MLLTGKGSFAETLSFLGVIAISLLGGIFPVLLLVSSRRRSRIAPCRVCRILGNPVFTTGIYLLYLVSLFLYGLVIWKDPVQRVVALAVGVTVLSMTIVQFRRRTLARRMVGARRGTAWGAFLLLRKEGGIAEAGR
jgi:hypothetical protein